MKKIKITNILKNIYLSKKIIIIQLQTNSFTWLLSYNNNMFNFATITQYVSPTKCIYFIFAKFIFFLPRKQILIFHYLQCNLSNVHTVIKRF